MLMDNRLRAYARQDLSRFSQGRNLTDTELAGPLLSAPGLSPRELDAATALDALAKFEALVKRTVEETTSPALDMDEPLPDVEGLTFDQVRDVWARREVYRRAALVYARMVGDEQLIEHYQTPEPAPEREHFNGTADLRNDNRPSEWIELAQKRADEILKRNKEKDLYPSQQNVADEIARDFRRDGVVGAGGKPLSGAYIKRHALKGISSEQGKRLSTSTRRGK